MTTIKEDFVSFETAKLLKEKNCPDFGYSCIYDSEGNKAQTQSIIMKWLREVHKIFIWIEYDPPTFIADIYKMDEVDEEGNAKYIPPTFANAKTYEQVVETAIKYCLEHLI